MYIIIETDAKPVTCNDLICAYYNVAHVLL